MEKLVSNLEQKEDYNAIIAKGDDWIDPRFPHDNSILQGIDGTFKWMRAEKIFGKQEKVYDSFSGDDIEQGVLGDCYLLSAISALAEFPGRVQKLFLQKDRNEAGCYVVKLFCSGEPVEICVDDYFPVDRNNRPAFAASKGGEMWVMLIEKAWAKLHGNFINIEGGDTRESLAALTGAPVEYYKFKDLKPEKLWEMLYNFDKHNFCMCTGSATDIKGIIKAHAYTLVGVHQFNYKGEDVKLVQIRNPWGCTEWEGEWGDKDPKWTAEMRTKLNHPSKDDGTFLMPFKDFSEIFVHFFVAKVHDEYVFNHLALKNKYGFATFNITKHVEGYISGYEVTKRLGSCIDKNYKTEPLKCELYKMEGDDAHLVKENYNNAVGVAHLEVALEPGTYVVKAAFEGPTLLPYITFTSYTDKPIDFAELKVKDLKEVDQAKIQDALKNIKKEYVADTPIKKKGCDFITCPVGHELFWSTDPSETGDRYACEGCRKPNSASAGRWLCKVCLYDICTECRPKPADAKKVEETKVMQCPNKHDLKFGTYGEKYGLYICDTCGKAYFGCVPRYYCEPCTHDVCMACKAPPADFKLAAKYPEIEKCNRGHKLEFLFTETKSGKYECLICSKLGGSYNGRWCCSACNINVCPICKPCDKATRIAVTAATKTVVCNKGHTLLFCCKPPPEGGVISCDKCKRPVAADNWRWYCEKCNFDVCVRCRPEYAGYRELICPRMHKLLYSALPQGNSNYGRCDKCRSTFKFTDGRYCCPACQYDICKKCTDAMNLDKFQSTGIFERSGRGHTECCCNLL